MQCRSCGTEIADNAIVCFRCGTPTADLPSAARAQPDRRRARARWGIVAAALVGAGGAVLAVAFVDGPLARALAAAGALVAAALVWRASARPGLGGRPSGVN